MSEQSSMHPFLNWTKQRIDEMDAAVASLEAKSGQLKADTKIKADQLIADLKKRRDEFKVKAKAQVEAGQAAWEAAMTQLEAQWQGFEAQLNTYFETAGKQIEQQQATFRDVATAHIKAWREAAEKFHADAQKMTAEKRADLEASVEQMKADAARIEERLHRAGTESWTALSTALAESRKAFDRANQQLGDALRRAASR